MDTIQQTSVAISIRLKFMTLKNTLAYYTFANTFTTVTLTPKM